MAVAVGIGKYRYMRSKTRGRRCGKYAADVVDAVFSQTACGSMEDACLSRLTEQQIQTLAREFTEWKGLRLR